MKSSKADAPNSRHKRRPPARGSKADPEQYQRFLDTARELGLDPPTEADLGRTDEVLRRLAKMPPERRGPMRMGKKPDEDGSDH